MLADFPTRFLSIRGLINSGLLQYDPDWSRSMLDVAGRLLSAHCVLHASPPRGLGVKERLRSSVSFRCFASVLVLLLNDSLRE